MNAIPPPSEPPFGADTDEAVSALLDGELGAFAAEHSTTETDARARLEAWPGFEERRATFAAARATVATPTPTVDELTRRRLLQRARLESPAPPSMRERPSRRWTAIGAVAAGLLFVAGVGLALNASSDGGGGSSDSASSADRVAPDLQGDIGDVGDLSGPDALRAVLTGKRDAETAREGADDAESAAGTGGSTSDQSGGTRAPASGQALSRSTAPALPPDQCAAQLAGDRPVTFVGTGTYQGLPVTVIGLTERGRVIAFLVPSNDCTNVLTSVSR